MGEPHTVCGLLDQTRLESTVRQIGFDLEEALIRLDATECQATNSNVLPSVGRPCMANPEWRC